MKYIVYETTNLINNKFYIGVHKQNGTNYLGSGKILKLAIKKYGKENFIRKTLNEFDNEQDAYDYEKLVVNEEMVLNHNCYNIVEGGGNPPTGFGINNNFYGKKHNKGSKDKISESKKGISIWNDNHPMKNKKHSVKTKNIMSLKRRGIDNPRSKKWFINGRLFNYAREASIFFNVSDKTIRRWCKNNIPHCYCV